jgi:D-arabinose 1-dehydrogenase-like Zn-dependent alcohol dehydrogenase
MGFRTVAISSSDAKRELAFSLGANDHIDTSKVNQAEALQAMGGARLVLCTAPNPDEVHSLINGLATGGTLLLLARKLPSLVPSQALSNF